MKIYRLLLGFLLLGGISLGQTHTFPALDTNNSFTGSNTGTGAWTLANTNLVLNPAICGTATPASWCSGADMGAWINAAEAFLAANAGGGAQCGKVQIPAGGFSYTTPILINHFGCFIEGAGRDATRLTYTPVTATIGWTWNEQSIIGLGFSVTCNGTSAPCMQWTDSNGDPVQGGVYLALKVSGGSVACNRHSTSISNGVWGNIFNIDCRNGLNNGLLDDVVSSGFVNNNSCISCLSRATTTNKHFTELNATGGQIAFENFTGLDSSFASGVGGIGFNCIGCTDLVLNSGTVESSTIGTQVDNGNRNRELQGMSHNADGTNVNDTSTPGPSNANCFFTTANVCNSITLQGTFPGNTGYLRLVDGGNTEADMNMISGVQQWIDGANYKKWSGLDGHTEQSGYFEMKEIAAPSGVAGNEICYEDSTTHLMRCSYNGGSFFNMPRIIANGTATMTTAAILAGNCGATVTVAAANVAATDTIAWSFNAAPAGSNAGLVAWPTAGNVNFAYCSNTAETPAAATINWNVPR